MKPLARRVAGSRPPSYSFTAIKAFTVAEIRDLGKLTHTEVGITNNLDTIVWTTNSK